jgi:2-oxoglutarate ferredoxin oxidoreductase subunit gamma
VTKEIRICGFGGQGIVLAGVVLGEAAVRSGLEAVQTQSYGPEARGGAARSEIVIATEPIAYPRVQAADVLVALSQPGYDRFAGELADGGAIIVEQSLVRAERAQSVPFVATAERVGRKIVANIVMVGYVSALLELDPDVVVETVLANVPSGTEDLNRKAVTAGRELHAAAVREM